MNDFSSYILECPVLNIVRHNTSAIGFNYSFQTHEVQIPFMSNYLQKVLFILAPRDDYKPNIDAVENSKALRGNAKQSVEWNQTDFGGTKSVLLKVDAIYLVILQVYGKLTQDMIRTKKQYATIDCVQKFGTSYRLSTFTWKCDNGERISSGKLCDYMTDCTDGSDESSQLCEADQDERVNHFIHSILGLGFLSYLLAYVMITLPYFNTKGQIVKDDDDLSEERRKCFTSMRNAFANLECKDGKEPRMKNEDLENVKAAYKECHNKGSISQLVFLESVQDFSIEPLHEDPCSRIIDSIVEEESKIHDDKKGGSTCMKRCLGLNLDNAGYVLKTIDRHSFFSKIFQMILSMPKFLCKYAFPLVLFLTVATFTAAMSIKNILVSYIDLSMDIQIFTAIRHVIDNFIFDEDKHQRVSKLPLEEMSYVYVISGLLSQFTFFAIYITDFKHLYEFQKSWSRRVIFILSVFFPIHFVTLEVLRYYIASLKIIYEFRNTLKKAVEKDSNVEELAEEYVKYRRNLKKNMDGLGLFRKSFIKMMMMEFLIENNPQIIMTTTFVMSEFKYGNGKLLNIIASAILKYVGGHLSILCGLMIVILMNKFTFGLLILQNRNQYPLGNGIAATVMQIIINLLIFGSKLVLLSTLFSNATFLYPLWIAFELVIALVYFRCTGIQPNIWQTVVPCLISPSLVVNHHKDPYLIHFS